MEQLISQIQDLKKQHNAVILAHYYQVPEVQDIADVVGDSFQLARQAQDTDADTIVLAGVRFMAETAKLLNPEKRVLLPVEDAGCPMADMVEPEDVMDYRDRYPEAAVVCYVNSSVAVKAVSDICCTSSNAVAIIRSLPNRQIIMVPDQNLADYVARFVPEKEIIPYPGYCPTHRRANVQDMEKARAGMPGAPVLVHPECDPDVVDAADFAGSTAQILKRVAEGSEKSFIIGTEWGVFHAISKASPDKELKLLAPGLICPNMKKTQLDDILDVLRNDGPGIGIPEDIRPKAAEAVRRMMEATHAATSV